MVEFTRPYLFKVLVLIACLCGQGAVQAEWFKEEHAIMGTEVAVELWHEDTVRVRQCASLVFDEMRRIDALMSPYKADSELSHINTQAANTQLKISDELFSLISKSLEYSKMSTGAFDITFSSVGYLYDYRKNQRPSDSTINDLLSAINYQHIVLDDAQHTITFLTKNVRIDLGGIAKGYAVDKAVNLLKTCGVQHGVVKAGGDSYLLGGRNGAPWVLGIKHPRQMDRVVVRLPLSNVAISTSGDYERFFIEDGKRIHHIIKPATGKPVAHNWSVTVIGNHAVETDALSTALFVMDIKSAMALLRKLPGIDAIIIDAQGEMHYSDGLVAPDSALH